MSNRGVFYAAIWLEVALRVWFPSIPLAEFLTRFKCSLPRICQRCKSIKVIEAFSRQGRVDDGCWMVFLKWNSGKGKRGRNFRSADWRWVLNGLHLESIFKESRFSSNFNCGECLEVFFRWLKFGQFIFFLCDRSRWGIVLFD